MLLFSSVALAFDLPSQAELAAAELSGELALRGHQAMRRGDLGACGDELLSAWDVDPDPAYAYDAAACRALDGDADAAFDALRAAVASGWTERAVLAADVAFADLRHDRRWRRLLAALDARLAARAVGSNPALAALHDAVADALTEGDLDRAARLGGEVRTLPAKTVVDLENRAAIAVRLLGSDAPIDRWATRVDLVDTAQALLERDRGNRRARRQIAGAAFATACGTGGCVQIPELHFLLGRPPETADWVWWGFEYERDEPLAWVVPPPTWEERVRR